MNFTKIAEISSHNIPIEWNGEFDGEIMEENILFHDGSVLEMKLTLNLPEMEMEEEDEEDDIYVLVEDNGITMKVHKDMLDVFLETMGNNE